MQIKHIDTILMVENIEVSKIFYREVMGLKILHDWHNMVVFTERFAIHQADALQPVEVTSQFIRRGKQGCGNVVLYFQTDDLEGCLTSLKAAGVPVLHEIINLPWERVFRFLDPDQHVIEMGEFHQE